MALVPCEAPLEITPLAASVAPRGVVILEGSGGTGNHVFSLDGASATGARIDERSGVFVAGTTMGEDAVVLRDARCTGEARATVTTTDAFAVSPSMLEVPPGARVTFTTTGGAGGATFALARSESGATLSASGAYVAGPTEGEDLVRATDGETGASSDAVVRVRAGAALRLVHELVAIPEDARLTPRVLGGSGVFDLASSSSGTVNECLHGGGGDVPGGHGDGPRGELDVHR